MAFIHCKCGVVKKNISDEHIGKIARCPKCKERVMVVENEPDINGRKLVSDAFSDDKESDKSETYQSEALVLYNKGVKAIQANNKEEAIKNWKLSLNANPELGIKLLSRVNLAIALSPEFIEIPEGTKLTEDQTERFHFVENNLIELVKLCKESEGKVQDFELEAVNSALNVIEKFGQLVLKADQGWYVFPGDETAIRLFKYGMNEEDKQKSRDALLRGINLLDEDNPKHKKMIIHGSVKIAAKSSDLNDHAMASQFAKKVLSYQVFGPDDMEYMAMKIILGENPLESPDKSGDDCFIATAVYNSENITEVIIFKLYRDIILKNNLYGKLFIKVYYLFSPIFANSIINFPKVKTYIKEYILNPLSKYCLSKILH